MDGTTLNIPLSAVLTEEDARAIFARGEEAVVFAIVELSKQLGDETVPFEALGFGTRQEEAWAQASEGQPRRRSFDDVYSRLGNISNRVRRMRAYLAFRKHNCRFRVEHRYDAPA